MVMCMYLTIRQTRNIFINGGNQAWCAIYRDEYDLTIHDAAYLASSPANLRKTPSAPKGKVHSLLQHHRATSDNWARSVSISAR